MYTISVMYTMMCMNMRTMTPWCCEPGGILASGGWHRVNRGPPGCGRVLSLGSESLAQSPRPCLMHITYILGYLFN